MFFLRLTFLMLLLSCNQSWQASDPLSLPAEAGEECNGVHEGNYRIETADDIAGLAGIAHVTGDLVADQVEAPSLASDCLRRIDGKLLLNRTELASLSFPALETIGGGFRLSYNDRLVAMDLRQLQAIGGSLDLHDDSALPVIALPALTEVGGDIVSLAMSALTELSLPVLQTVKMERITSMPSGQGIAIRMNGALTTLTFPQLTLLAGAISIDENLTLREFSIPRLADLKGLSISGNHALSAVSAPLLERTKRLLLHHNVALEIATYPGLVAVDSLMIEDMSTLATIALPKLTTSLVFQIRGNPILSDFDLGTFVNFTGNRIYFHDNGSLPQCRVESLVQQLRAAGFTGDTMISGNRDECP